MKSKIKFGSSTIQYSIVKSKRRKTSQIVVDKNDVIIRAPATKTLPEIKQIMKDKAQWVFKKQLEFQKIKPQIAKATFTAGSKLPYLGKNYQIKIITKQKANSIQLAKERFTIKLQPSRSSRKTVQNLYENWLARKADGIFDKKIAKFSKRLKLKPKKAVIKNLKDRWGSLSQDETLNLNMNLLKAPDDVIDYVILHELTHLKIKAHTHHFWESIHKFMPNYEQKRLWLEHHGQRIV